MRILLALLVCASANAQLMRVATPCTVGGKVVVTSSLTSTTLVQQSYPQCTQTVYLTGTTTKATIYSEQTGTTPLSNPFNADNNGYGYFYVQDGVYDIQLSGGLPPSLGSPYTYGAVPVNSPLFQQPGAPTFAAGSVSQSEKQKLAQTVNAADFGVVCDAPYTGISGTDNAASIRAAYTYALLIGGQTIKFPHQGSALTNACGIKSSLVFGTNGASIPITFDFDSPGAPGFVLLTGGSWSTYTSNFDSSSHTFGVMFGPVSCSVNTAYTTMQNFFVQGNSQVDTPFVNSCAQENSGLDNVLVTGCNYTCIELQYAGFNSSYKRLNLLPNANSYGIIAGCELNCEIDHLTVSGAEASGGVSSKAGIIITAGPIHITDFHCESMDRCVDNKNVAVLVTPSCGPNIATACVVQESSAVGVSIKGLLMIGNAGGGTMVKDGLNNWTGSGSGYSTIAGFSVGNYESWNDVGTSTPFLASSNLNVPWLIPNSVTTTAANVKGNLAFGYNAGSSNAIFGNYQAGFTNCNGTHYCFFDMGDQVTMIQKFAQSGAGTTAAGGLSLLGNGFGADPSVGMIGAGWYGNDATPTAAAGSGSGTASSILFHDNYIQFQLATGLTANSNFSWTIPFKVTPTEITMPVLPTSAGSGGLYVCIDTSGNLYKKSACP